MLKKHILSIISLIIICLYFFSVSSYAENTHLLLSIQDLTWLSCKPNENIEKVIETLRKNYKIDMSSMEYAGLNSYVAGDPTPAMSWILSIKKNPEGKLVGMDYGRFKESNGGVWVRTSRGIEYGSNIRSVYDAYGSHPVVIRTPHPMMNYIDLQYSFVLKETGQKGKVVFTLQYNFGDPDQTATVITIKWNFV